MRAVPDDLAPRFRDEAHRDILPGRKFAHSIGRQDRR
jgi:hypothetical protein